MPGTFAVDHERTGFIGRRLERLAEETLSKRIKRLIFISSIIGLIKNMKSPEQEALEKVNSIFNIAKDPNAIALPMYAKSLIWRDLCNKPIEVSSGKVIFATSIDKQEFTNHQYQNIVDFFFRHTPKWLKYDEDVVMRGDINKIIKNLYLLRTE